MPSNEPLELVPASMVKESPAPAAEPATQPDKSADTGAASADDPGENPPDEGQKARKRQRDFRIDEYYRLNAENQRNQDIIRRMAERGLDPQGQPQVPVKGDWKSGNREPREEDFPGNYEAYLDARVEWRTEQKLTEREVRAKREAQARQQNEQQEKFRERLHKGAEKYPDFEEVALSADVPMSEAMAYAIADSDSSADIAYHLGKNPQEAARIAALPPWAAAREIGKIEDRIAAAPAPNATTTAAPKPIRTVAGTNAPRAVDLDKIPIDEFMRIENEKDRIKRFGR